MIAASTYDDDQPITEEKSVRSWSKPDGISNLIGRKQVDKSIFMNGSHIPLKFIEDFDRADGDYHLDRGESKDVFLLLNGFQYKAKLVNSDRKGYKPSFIFVNSMSDLFHEQIPTDFIMKAFEVMNKATWHTFQILTKRSERLAEIAGKLNWTSNIWQGVTVESDECQSRINDLRMRGVVIRLRKRIWVIIQ